MIHYYFGNKLALLQQVLERALEPLADAIASMNASNEAPAPEIARLLLRTFNQHPSLPILIVREVLLPGGVMQAHFLEYLAPRLGGSVPGLLAKEQSAGRMRPDVDPHIGALSLLSLCAFPFFARELAEPVLGICYEPEGLLKLEQHITLLLSEGYST
jgi:AcrR family transcriptional regulator